MTEEVVHAASMISVEQRRDIQTFADAKALATEVFGTVTLAADVLGDGFVLLKDKNKLVNVPFVILSFSFHTDEKTEQEYVVVRLVTINDQKIIITDGGTGIYAQLSDLRGRGIEGGIGVNGLRVSEYEVFVDGKTSMAASHYLSS